MTTLAVKAYTPPALFLRIPEMKLLQLRNRMSLCDAKLQLKSWQSVGGKATHRVHHANATQLALFDGSSGSRLRRANRTIRKSDRDQSLTPG